MQIEQTTLKNGLNTLFVHSPGSTAASVQVWFKAGSALEEAKNQGIAHFLEHMFFKGTPSRPGAQIAYDVENLGGEVNAFTSFDYTSYYINTPVKGIEKSIEILMDMVSSPMFNKEDIEPERNVVFEEYRRSQDNTNQYGFQKVQESAFKNGYQHPILGSEKTIKAFSQEQLKAFREKFYNLSNMLLVVSGDLPNKVDLKKVIETFSPPEGPKSTFPKFILNKKSSVQTYDFDTNMAKLILTIQGPGYQDYKSSAEDLALNCLSYGETSRLTREIVIESVLANSLSGSTMYFSKGGCHFIKINAPAKNLSKIYKEFIRILNDLRVNPLKEKEVSKIKNQYLASKIYERESLEDFTFSLGHGYAQTGDIHCEKDFIDRLKLTSTNDVNVALMEIFKRPVQCSLQLPKKSDLKRHQKECQNFIDSIKKVVNSPVKLAKKKKGVSFSEFDPAVTIFKVSPGITLIHKLNRTAPTFNCQVYIKSGLAQEMKSNNGIHALLSNTLAKGHKGVSYDELKAYLEYSSSNISGFSGKNAYGLSLTGLIENSEKLFSYFFGTLLHPELKTKHVNMEKKLLLRAIESEKKDHLRQCLYTFNEIIFQGHPYAMPAIGNKSSIRSLTSDALKRFHQKCLKNRDIVITYSGDESYDTFTERVLPHLKKLKSRDKIIEKKNTIKKNYQLTKHIVFEREQTNIVLGIPSFRYSQKETIFVKMLTNHLSGQSSRLFVEVRDKRGLCYAVQPLNFTGIDGGYWGVYIGAGKDKSQEAIDSILEILQELQSKGVTENELVKIKAMVLGQSQLNIQTNSDFVNLYSVPVLHGFSVDNHFKINKKIEDTSLKDFNLFLKKFLSKKMNIISTGPNF